MYMYVIAKRTFISVFTIKRFDGEDTEHMYSKHLSV